ncbi:PRCC domain-containing protein [Aspergillus tanneri]|uniref:Mitotic checkpoint regulator, MAD2B-interacting-domain-containing protein n=1 Tax=Aspergillus tanneri TaxID=1220188 RepID=A0A5M9MXP3_9EURO|nr:uncharacterized protein ATNIH1004_003424 [Aspergillus tanneri]KAA8650736.1 hypothetical protein ATNIH1004_003424 [Aspergillus tanneri]
MALVSYSDSETSDLEPENNVTQTKDKKQTLASAPSSTSSGANFQSIVERSNPRKIRVALPEIKPENLPDNSEDGPARKKARIGGGGGAFSGFNSFLPAPKRTNAAVEKENKASAQVRKVFSLKTGATPGFDREADAEMRRDQLLGASATRGGDYDDDGGTIPKAGGLRAEEDESTAERSGVKDAQEKPVEVKLKGNPMMFKPLSVGRASQQKKKLPPKTATTASSAEGSKEVTKTAKEVTPAQPTPPPVAKKTRVSLFSLSTGEADTTSGQYLQEKSAVYEPMVYTAGSEVPAAGPELDSQEPFALESTTGPAQTLDNIADDLHLSRAERRQLFGRHGDSSKSRILHFNTDREYAANQEMAHNTDLAAVQHNPVRPIAPGKHSLQQLVNAASSQREALEDSFASGRRNKKEAGSKYGW